MTKKILIQALSLASFLGLTLLPSWTVAATLLVQGAYCRATVPGQEVGAAYLAVGNASSQEDRLVGASTPAARTVELHTTQQHGGMSHMQREPSLAIPAHGMLELKPGAAHLMLLGLKQPLKEGQSIPITLRFEKSGPQTIQFPVKPVDASGEMGQSDHGSMKMDY